jgi:hypothetical protein
MRIYQTTFSLTETSRNWNRGIGLLATLAIAVAGFASTSYASIITVPAGLVAGDTYRLVFVTADTYQATSTNIATYNADVTTEADSITALAALDTTWSAIGSTSTVNAITNIGTDANVPIYNFDGQLVADDATTDSGGIFSGALLNAILIDELGLSPSIAEVWTGTSSDGDGFPTRYLGTTIPMTGKPQAISVDWDAYTTFAEAEGNDLYAISGVLTVESSTPEPATTGTMIMGVAVVYLAARRRQRIRRAN